MPAKQLVIIFLNKEDYLCCLNNIISNYSTIEYYIVYKDKSIDKKYYIIYFQSPYNGFSFNKFFNPYCCLYYRNSSNIIYDYIKKYCKIINEKGNYNNLRRSNITRDLKFNEFKNIDELKQKAIDFYINKLKHDDVEINDDVETELEDNHTNKKFKPSFCKPSPQPIISPIIPISNNINIDSWKNNFINIDIKQVKILYFYGISDTIKTNKIKEYIKNNIEEYGNIINDIYYDGNYWYGIGTANICIYDNFKDRYLNYHEFIEFIDNEVHYLKTKNGNVKNNYKLIIFSSIENSEYIYINAPDDIREKIKNSITVIKCFN